MSYVLNDNNYRFYLNSSMSPRIRRFVEGLNSGSAPLDWSKLESFKQSDGTIFRLMASWRSYDEQCNLYSSGRLVTKSKDVEGNKYRYKILTDKIVYPSAVCTYAFGGKSYHNYGLAVDIVFRAVGELPRGSGVTRGAMSWDSVEEFYKDIGLLAWAKECGLSWGGYWSKPYDPVHFEDEHYTLPMNPWNTDCNFSALVAEDETKVLEESGGSGVGRWIWVLLAGLALCFGVFWG